MLSLLLIIISSISHILSLLSYRSIHVDIFYIESGHFFNDGFQMLHGNTNGWALVMIVLWCW